jgi:S1-C subfamily serine protease
VSRSRNLVVVISAVLAVVTLSACQSLGVPTNPELQKKYAQMYLPTVVVINQESGGVGSGVLIDRIEDSYLVLSAAHVVTDKTQVQIAFTREGPRYVGVVLRTSTERDLALIRVRLKFEDRPVAKLCSSEPHMFEEVFAVGVGLGEPLFPTQGIVGNTRYYFDDYPDVRYLHHSAPIAPGNSGGPLYKRERGEYCITGINLRGRSAGSQFAYAAHLYELYAFLRNDPLSAKSN